MASHIPVLDESNARRVVLAGMANGVELSVIYDQLNELRRNGHEFAGDVLLLLAADALAMAGVTRDSPLQSSDLRKQFLPDCSARNRVQHYKSKWVISAAAMIHGGVDPCLDEEIAFWSHNDLWAWSFEALVLFVRAGAAHSGRSVADFARMVAAQHDLVLESTGDP